MQNLETVQATQKQHFVLQIGTFPYSFSIKLKYCTEVNKLELALATRLNGTTSNTLPPIIFQVQIAQRDLVVWLS